MNLSIQNMNYVMREIEMSEEKPGYMERVAALPADQKSHYWFIERKAKRGNKWIFVRDLMATKREAAEIFMKHFRGKEPKYRIRHMLVY